MKTGKPWRDDRCVTPEQKREAIEELLELWKEWPQLRLGQLISNVHDRNSCYYMEDRKFVEALKNFYGQELLMALQGKLNTRLDLDSLMK